MFSKISKDERQKMIKDGKDKFNLDLLSLSSVEPKKYNLIITLPSTIQKLFYLSYTGKTTRNQAIKAKCLDCSCFDKEEVRNCSAKLCPLYKFRPYQK